MPNNASAKSRQMITTFKQADDLSAAMIISRRDKLPGHHFKPVVAHLHLSQRVLPMGIESR